jgi:hypothetical protein
MSSPSPLPAYGEVFLDERGGTRTLRVSWHDEVGVVVLSLWRRGVCVGSFRLDADEVPEMIEVLSAGPTSRRATSRRWTKLARNSGDPPGK